MSKATLLSKLKLTATPIRTNISPTIKKRNNLITKLKEQLKMTHCMLNSETFTAYKHKWITNADTGLKERQKLPKLVRTWYYIKDDIWFIDLRYGNRRLNIANGKSTIEVGKQGQLVSTFEILIAAAEAGELDEQLSAFQRKSIK